MKRRHFTTKQYTQELSSSSESDSEENDSEPNNEKTLKLPKIQEIKELAHTNTDNSANSSLYKVIETSAKPIDKLMTFESDPASLDEANGTGSDLADSDDDSDDDSESSDDDEEEEEIKILKPTFVPKNKRLTMNNGSHVVNVDKKKEITMQKLQHNISTVIEQEKLKNFEANSGDLEELGDVDDTDDLNPELEYAMWKEREIARLKVQREKLIKKEQEEEETYKRREEYDNGVLQVDGQEINRDKKVGAFFNN